MSECGLRQHESDLVTGGGRERERGDCRTHNYLSFLGDAATFPPCLFVRPKPNIILVGIEVDARERGSTAHRKCRMTSESGCCALSLHSCDIAQMEKCKNAKLAAN